MEDLIETRTKSAYALIDGFQVNNILEFFEFYGWIINRSLKNYN